MRDRICALLRHPNFIDHSYPGWQQWRCPCHEFMASRRFWNWRVRFELRRWTQQDERRIRDKR